MRYHKYWAAAASCFVLSFLCLSARMFIPSGNPAAQISPSILRFHVLAAGNSRNDQKIKLEVRSLLLDLIYDGLKSSGSSGSKDQVKNYIARHRLQLEQAAEECMAAHGCPSAARIQVADAYFPEKTYGPVTLPAGTYEALEVTLGEGRGRNWWCILYPSLCVTRDTYAAVSELQTSPEAPLRELEDKLDPNLYHAVVKPRLKLSRLLFPCASILPAAVKDNPADSPLVILDSLE